MDRRKFLTVSGVSLGAGALYTMAPRLVASAEGGEHDAGHYQQQEFLEARFHYWVPCAVASSRRLKM